MNNYLPLLPGSINVDKIVPEELSDILPHSIPNSWAQQAYIQGWDFEVSTYKDTCGMFERIEIAEAIYKGGSPSKNNQWEEYDRASSGRKKIGRASASPSNPKQGRAGNRNRSDAGHPRDDMTGAKKTFMLHGTGHSSE